MTRNRRMTLTVAVACVLSSLVLYPLFEGSQWFYAGAGAVITVAAFGALSRLRTLPVVICLLIVVAGLLLYLNLVFEARYSWVIIPSGDSLTRLGQLASLGITDTRRYAPPAPARPDLVLLAAGGIGITAIAADLIAVRLRSAALAGLPLLVLFTVPVTMNAQHEGIGTAIVFGLGAAGYLAMLSADGRDRIRVWGRLVSLWRSGSLSGTYGSESDGTVPASAAAGAAVSGGTVSGGTVSGGRRGASEDTIGPDTRALAAAGRRVGLASVVLALFVPLIVPGLHPSKLFSSGAGIGGHGGSGTSAALPDTLQQTLQQLQETHRPTTVLTYTTSAPGSLMANDPPYLRTYVYDSLGDGGQWTGDYASGQQQASTLPPAQGLANPGVFPQYTVAVKVADNALTSRSLPTFLALPYPAVQVAATAGNFLTDPKLMVFSSSPATDVQAYRGTFAAVDPTAAQLDRAAPPPASVAADLTLPASFQTAALKQIARQETAGYTTEFGKVNALAAWLSGPQFSYSSSAPPVNSPATLLNFLTKVHSGVCVQAAYAMTVLTRLLGIPARLAGGFTEGTRSGTGYVVKTDDAHAWSEVYFSGYGWVKFEATPSGGDGTARAGSYQTSGTAAGSGTSAGSDASGASTGPNKAATVPGAGARKLIPDDTGDSGSGPANSAGTPWTAIALAVAAAIALVAGIVGIAASPARRALAAQPADGARRRRTASLPAVALVAGAAVIVALALYRLLSHTSGLNLRAGWVTVGIAFAAAGAAALIVPGVLRVARRRWRWSKARDDAGRAHAAWLEFRDDLQDLGMSCPPSEPPRTLAARVGAGLPETAQAAVSRLALAEERACYAAQPSGSAELRADGAEARRGIAAAAGRGRRWRARIFPASVMSALADGAARIPDRLAALVSRHSPAR
jgi:transglutaminase-like putative cysteine protease